MGYKKADATVVEEQLAEKVDRVLFEGLLDRFNKFEEMLLTKRMKSPKGKSSLDPSSPSSHKKTDGAEGEEDADDGVGADSEEGRLEEKAAMESLRNKLEE